MAETDRERDEREEREEREAREEEEARRREELRNELNGYESDLNRVEDQIARLESAMDEVEVSMYGTGDRYLVIKNHSQEFSNQRNTFWQGRRYVTFQDDTDNYMYNHHVKYQNTLTGIYEIMQERNKQLHREKKEIERNISRLRRELGW